MTITVGVDTYATVAEADEYFTARYGYDSWDGLTELTKEQTLVSAFSQMNALCTWHEELSNPYPQGIKDAQCEIAFAVHSTNSTATDGGAALTGLSAGSVKLQFDSKTTGNPLVNDLTSSLLAEYGLCSTGGSTKIIPICVQ